MKQLVFLATILFCSNSFSQDKNLQTIDKIITNKKSNISEIQIEKSDILINQNCNSLLKINPKITQGNNNQIDIVEDRKFENDPLANSILKENPKNKL